MQKIDKTQQAELSRLDQELDAAGDKLIEAIQTFNTWKQEWWQKVAEAQEAYNALVSEAKELVEGLRDEVETYYDERSEKWQESDRGQVYQGWLQEFQQIDLEEADLEEPPELDIPDCLGQGQQLLDLNHEPGW